MQQRWQCAQEGRGLGGVDVEAAAHEEELAATLQHDDATLLRTLEDVARGQRRDVEFAGQGEASPARQDEAVARAQACGLGDVVHLQPALALRDRVALDPPGMTREAHTPPAAGVQTCGDVGPRLQQPQDVGQGIHVINTMAKESKTIDY